MISLFFFPFLHGQVVPLIRVQQQEEKMHGIERQAEKTSVMKNEEHDVSQVQEVQTARRLQK